MSDEAKQRRAMANYRNAPRCGNCVYFQTPTNCRLLAANIKSTKICDKHKPSQFLKDSNDFYISQTN